MADDTTQLDATFVRRTPHTPWWNRGGIALERLIATLPKHRDSRSGRTNATQARVALMALGIFVIVFWDHPWAPGGLLICATALVLPISEGKRRSLVAQLRVRRTTKTRLRQSPATLTLTAKHLELTGEDGRLRRVLRKNITVEPRADGLRVTAGKKRSDQLVVCSHHDADWIEEHDLKDGVALLASDVIEELRANLG